MENVTGPVGIEISDRARHDPYLQEIPNDTNPTATIIKFYIKSELNEFLFNETGKKEYKNYIQIMKCGELGRNEVHRRINDKVEWDESKQKWVVQKFAQYSDIRAYPDEWARFADGLGNSPVGTPLDSLIQNDPAILDYYRYNKIFTIEQMACISDGECATLGGHAREYRSKAQAFLAKQSKDKVTNRERELEERLARTEAQLAEVLSRPNLQAVHDSGGVANPPKKKGRPKKIKEVLEDEIA